MGRGYNITAKLLIEKFSSISPGKDKLLRNYSATKYTKTLRQTRLSAREESRAKKNIDAAFTGKSL